MAYRVGSLFLQLHSIGPASNRPPVLVATNQAVASFGAIHAAEAGSEPRSPAGLLRSPKEYRFGSLRTALTRTIEPPSLQLRSHRFFGGTMTSDFNPRSGRGVLRSTQDDVRRTVRADDLINYY